MEFGQFAVCQMYTANALLHTAKSLSCVTHGKVHAHSIQTSTKSTFTMCFLSGLNNLNHTAT